MKILSMDDVDVAAKRLAKELETSAGFNHPGMQRGYTEPVLYGVPRGGIAAALAVARHLEGALITDDPALATVFVDDLIDSGATRDRYLEKYPGIPFLALFDKGDDWLVFPWEGTVEGSAEDIPVRLLQFIGEDPARGGLLETPKRYLKAWQHWAGGYKEDPAALLKCFEDGAEKCDEMVLVKSIPVYSHCEHHLAPFFGTAHVAYIPDGRIVGLSKISRLVDVFARRLQVQERLTNQIADAMEQNLKPKGVAVVIECRHLCMESRGIQRQGSSTTTSAMRGVFRDNAAARAEFMGLVR
jgi:GTP cyclohydrolase IA